MLALLLCKPANLEQNCSISYIYIYIYHCIESVCTHKEPLIAMKSLCTPLRFIMLCWLCAWCSVLTSYTWCSGFMQAKLQACLFCTLAIFYIHRAWWVPRFWFRVVTPRHSRKPEFRSWSWSSKQGRSFCMPCWKSKHPSEITWRHSHVVWLWTAALSKC